MDFFKILYPIEWVVAWIMYLAHSALTWVGLNPESGLAWALSIVVLVIVMRIILIPLFFKQIRSSRGMQLLAPEMQAIQKKYKGKTDPASREAMSRETMALYKKHGTNPFSSCLPILAQSPIFFALFRVLTSLDEIASGVNPALGPINETLAKSAEQSTIFGAPLSSTFMTAATSTSSGATRFVTVALIVAMSATTFLTQRQLTMKNMPPAALVGPMAQQQKVLLYVLPLVFAFSGVNFPIGVLLYWTTTNIWSMGQQFYTIRRMPAPGSEAERLMRERKARKARARGETVDPTDASGSLAIDAPQPKGQRSQPVRKDRTRTKPVPGTAATRPTDGSTRPPRPPRPAPAAGEARVKRSPADSRSTPRPTADMRTPAEPGEQRRKRPPADPSAPRRKRPPTDSIAPRPKRASGDPGVARQSRSQNGSAANGTAVNGTAVNGTAVNGTAATPSESRPTGTPGEDVPPPPPSSSKPKQ